MKEAGEILEGYVVDIACVRKYPRRELLDRARQHSKECANMGHCVESGFALVSEDGGLALLDAAATPRVLDAIRQSGRDSGIKIRAAREMKEGDMETTRIELLDSYL